MIKFIETYRIPYSKLLENKKGEIEYSVKHNVVDMAINKMYIFEDISRDILKNVHLKECDWD